MKKSAWALRLKQEISESEYNGRTLYLDENSYDTDSEFDWLTDDLQKANIIYDKEKYIYVKKVYDEALIKKFGKEAIRNFGWENISKNFDFVEVEVTE